MTDIYSKCPTAEMAISFYDAAITLGIIDKRSFLRRKKSANTFSGVLSDESWLGVDPPTVKNST